MDGKVCRTKLQERELRSITKENKVPDDGRNSPPPHFQLIFHTESSCPVSHGGRQVRSCQSSSLTGPMWVAGGGSSHAQALSHSWGHTRGQDKRARVQSTLIYSPPEVLTDPVLPVSLVSARWEQEQGLLQREAQPRAEGCGRAGLAGGQNV